VNDRTLAEAAHHAAIRRLLHYASAPDCELRRGDGWVAVRTGAHSNDLNGVVSEPGAPISPATAADVIRWFGRTPASWYVARPDSRLTDLLVAAGARPERLGRSSGGSLSDVVAEDGPGVGVLRVAEPGQLDTWLDLAAACGWLDDPDDRATRRGLYAAVGLDGPGPLRHWLSVVDDEPVGFATSFLVDGTVDLCNLGVLPSWRRRGVGRALVLARLRDAARWGATRLVSAPSPDGWQLQRTLGFRNVPVVADTCFYLPGTG
jgi:GNAT superfamily N-acetyltransferase